MTRDAKQAARLEKKLRILLGGYQVGEAEWFSPYEGTIGLIVLGGYQVGEADWFSPYEGTIGLIVLGGYQVGEAEWFSPYEGTIGLIVFICCHLYDFGNVCEFPPCFS